MKEISDNIWVNAPVVTNYPSYPYNIGQVHDFISSLPKKNPEATMIKRAILSVVQDIRKGKFTPATFEDFIEEANRRLTHK